MERRGDAGTLSIERNSICSGQNEPSQRGQRRSNRTAGSAVLFLEGTTTSSALRGRLERRWRGISESGLNTVSVMRHRLVSPRNGNARSGKILSSSPLSLSPFSLPKGSRVNRVISDDLARSRGKSDIVLSRSRAADAHRSALFYPFRFFHAFLSQFFLDTRHTIPSFPHFFPFLGGSTNEGEKKEKEKVGRFVGSRYRVSVIRSKSIFGASKINPRYSQRSVYSITRLSRVITNIYSRTTRAVSFTRRG